MEELSEVVPGANLRYAPKTWGVRSLARYDLGQAIGEGTYGKVFKATALVGGKKETVALKMIIRHHEDEGFPKTETREIKILKSIRHPNMVNLREVVSSLGSAPSLSSKLPTMPPPTPQSASGAGKPGKEKDEAAVLGLYDRMGDVFMVFDYVDYDLAGLLDSGYQFSMQQVKSITFQLLQVLDYLHSHPQKYVHRDLKCSNLLLTDNNVLKLGDFGLARSLIKYDPAARLSNTVITLWYRAPEVLLGSTEYTAAVDMWSVGCILLELCIGKPAFPARHEAEQIKNIFRVIGTPLDGSYLRTLPLWAKFEIEERKSQIGDWQQKHERLKDPELFFLICRMLEGDPDRRITAREALGAKWFASAPKIDRDYPNAGLPPISASPGFVKGIDHHEFAAKKRRKASEFLKNAEVSTQFQELSTKVDELIALTFSTAQEAQDVMTQLKTMEDCLLAGLATMTAHVSAMEVATTEVSGSSFVEKLNRQIKSVQDKRNEIARFLDAFSAKTERPMVRPGERPRSGSRSPRRGVDRRVSRSRSPPRRREDRRISRSRSPRRGGGRHRSRTPSPGRDRDRYGDRRPESRGPPQRTASDDYERGRGRDDGRGRGPEDRDRGRDRMDDERGRLHQDRRREAPALSERESRPPSPADRAGPGDRGIRDRLDRRDRDAEDRHHDRRPRSRSPARGSDRDGGRPRLPSPRDRRRRSRSRSYSPRGARERDGRRQDDFSRGDRRDDPDHRSGRRGDGRR